MFEGFYVFCAKIQKNSEQSDIYYKNCTSNYMLLTEMSAYSNAVQQYGKDAADFWSQYDFSPTKRANHGDRFLILS